MWAAVLCVAAVVKTLVLGVGRGPVLLMVVVIYILHVTADLRSYSVRLCYTCAGADLGFSLGGAAGSGAAYFPGCGGGMFQKGA